MNFQCRHCSNSLNHEIIDLGHQPPSNAYLTKNDLSKPEITYPLKVFVCEKCWLVQIPTHIQSKGLFTKDYAYFSSTSSSWCRHAEKFVLSAIKKLGLNKNSLVLEIASNDGYLLQYVKRHQIPCIGIEPTNATAKVAKSKGIQTIEEFFSLKLAEQLIEEESFKQKVDLLVANNVIAHVPDINDFFRAILNVLKPNGCASIEFPHLLNLIKFNQFDTIYHEHYSYLSLGTVKKITESVGMIINDVEKIQTHGGSLRVWITPNRDSTISKKVGEVLDEEISYGLESICLYKDFQNKAQNVKNELLNFLLTKQKEKKKVIGYGAAAKGNTLLNYSGIKSDLIFCIADKSESKQGKYAPGSKIPIVSPEKLLNIDSKHIIIFPWNLIDELKPKLNKYNIYTSIPSFRRVHSSE